MMNKKQQKAVSDSIRTILPVKRLNILICPKCGKIKVSSLTSSPCLACAPIMTKAKCSQCKWFGLATYCLSLSQDQVACPMEGEREDYSFRPRGL